MALNTLSEEAPRTSTCPPPCTLLCPDTPATPAVSVVVPTYNRPHMLKRCLDALLGQENVAGDVEILIVDDARSAEQEAMLQEYLHRLGPIMVRYLRPPGTAHGPAAARNTGWRSARAPLIAFTDDDTLPDSNWLSEGVLAMVPGVDAAWGHVVVPLRDNPTDAERNMAGLHGAEFVTANCFVRREALSRVGGFDERFERAWREDSDLHFTLLEAGCRIVAAPRAIVTHPARTAPPGTSIRQHCNLFFEALLYKKHPRLYRERISAGPPRDYYVIAIAALIALAGMLAKLAPLTGVAALVWFALTLRLTARRLWGTSRSWLNVADIVVSSALIPLVAVFWRLAGAVRFRVLFV